MRASPQFEQQVVVASPLQDTMPWAIVLAPDYRRALSFTYVVVGLSCRCSDARAAATSPTRVVSVPHTILLVVPAHRRLPSHMLCHLPHMVFITPSGSHSPTLSSILALLHAINMASSSYCWFCLRHLLCLHLAQAHRSITVSSPTTSSTPTTVGYITLSNPASS